MRCRDRGSRRPATPARRASRGSAPDTQPRTRIRDDAQIGLGWITSPVDGRAVTWHNGGTGGFRSWVGFDREAGRGVVVLSASDRDVDQLGEHMLGVAPAPGEQGWSVPGVQGLLALGFLVLAVYIAVSVARRTRAGRVEHRLDLVGGIAGVVAILAIAWRRGPWLETSWLLWSVAATVCGAAAVVQCWYAAACHGGRAGGDRSRVQ